MCEREVPDLNARGTPAFLDMCARCGAERQVLLTVIAAMAARL